MKGQARRWRRWGAAARRFWASLRRGVKETAALVAAITTITAGYYALRTRGDAEPAGDAERKVAVIPGIRIIERSTTLDLSDWRATSEDDIARGVRRSPVVSRNRFLLERVNPEQREFVHRIGTTSKIDPELECTGCRLERVKSEAGPLARQWDLVFDVSDRKVAEPIQLSFNVRFWNAFQSPDQWWGGFRILHATERAIFKVVFPAAKKPKRKDLEFVYVIAATQKRVSDPPRDGNLHEVLDSDDRVSQLQWTVNNPNPDRSYRVYWKWE